MTTTQTTRVGTVPQDPSWIGFRNGEVIATYPNDWTANAALLARKVEAVAPRLQGFAWTVEGDLVTGPLDRLAADYSACYYSGLDIELPANVEASFTGYDEDDYATVTFKHGRASVSVRIDGRA